jgi:hypothetical protein
MGRFELWDVLRVGRLVMGRFESGTFSDGTIRMCIMDNATQVFMQIY